MRENRLRIADDGWNLAPQGQTKLIILPFAATYKSQIYESHVCELSGESVQNLGRFGADAEVRVSFGEKYGPGLAHDIRRGQREAPTLIAIDERNVDKDAAVVILVE